MELKLYFLICNKFFMCWFKFFTVEPSLFKGWAKWSGKFFSRVTFKNWFKFWYLYHTTL